MIVHDAGCPNSCCLCAYSLCFLIPGDASAGNNEPRRHSLGVLGSGSEAALRTSFGAASGGDTAADASQALDGRVSNIEGDSAFALQHCCCCCCCCALLLCPLMTGTTASFLTSWTYVDAETQERYSSVTVLQGLPLPRCPQAPPAC